MHPNKGKLRRPWGGGWVNKDLITFLPHQALPSSIVQLAPPLPVLHLATSPPIYPHNKRRDVHVPFSWHGKPRLDQPLFSHLQDLGRSPSYLPPSCAKLSPNPESATPSGIHFPGAPQNNEGRSAHHKARLRHRPPAGQLMAVWAGGDDRVVGTTLCGMGGDMVPVSVFHHSAFWFCRPVSRVHGALDLFYRVVMGSSTANGSQSSVRS